MNELLSRRDKLGNIFIKMFQGIASSKDSVYFLKEADEKNDFYSAYSLELEERIEIEKGLVKPLLLGNQVHRYESLRTKNLVVFPYNLPPDASGRATLMSEDQISREYPKGWEYLKRCESVLRGRERGRVINDDSWYRYIYPKNLILFKEPKLIAPDISLGGNFSIDYHGDFYTTTTLYGYLKKDGVWESYEYWLALLNSSVLWFYLKNSGSVLANGYFRYKPAYLENFPVPSPSKRQVNTITKLVRMVLLARKIGSIDKDPRINFLENVIDACVFELYFHLHMQKQNLLFLEDVATLVKGFESEANEAEQVEFLEYFYRTSNTPDHPIRNRLLRLTSDSPNLLAVIKE